MRKRIYIIGAGFAGITIAKELKSKGIFGDVLAFLDDDPEKNGKKIADIPVIDLSDRQQAFLDKPLENRVGHAQGEPDNLRQVPLAYG